MTTFETLDQHLKFVLKHHPEDFNMDAALSIYCFDLEYIPQWAIDRMPQFILVMSDPTGEHDNQYILHNSMEEFLANDNKRIMNFEVAKFVFEHKEVKETRKMSFKRFIRYIENSMCEQLELNLIGGTT